MANVVIPNNAFINTKDEHIIHNIEGQTKDVMNKKNTLEFKSDLSPMYYEHDSKVYTTSGHKLSISGSNVVDEEERTYSIDPTWVYISADISNLWSGECTSAFATNQYVISLWKNENSFTVIRSSWDNTITGKNTYNLSSYTPSTNLLYYNVKLADEDTIILERVFTDNTSRIDIIAVSSGNVVASLDLSYLLGSDLYTYVSGSLYYIGTDDTDVRKRFVFEFDGLSISLFCAGFGCIGANGLITGEPIPTPSLSVITSLSGYQFLSNGIGTFDSFYNTTLSDNQIIESNKDLLDDTKYIMNDPGYAMIWGTTPYNIDHSRKNMYWVAGYDLTNNNKPLLVTNTYIEGETPQGTGASAPQFTQYFDISSAGARWSWSNEITQVDFSDAFGNITWDKGAATIENGCNPFPYRYSVFNRAESKGVYWDYGPGWARSYFRAATIGGITDKDNHNRYDRAMCEYIPACIISFGLSSVDGKNQVRVEPLSPFTIDNEFKYYSIIPDEEHPHAYSKKYMVRANSPSSRYSRFHLFNADACKNGLIWCDMIGGDNLPNHSVLSALPFNVDIDALLNVKQQYYALNYLSTSMKGCLLTSASLSNKGICSYKSNHSYYASIFSDNLIIYCVRNAGSSNNIKLTKVADYMYKTNTLLGNNLFIDSKNKILAMRGFIPYNGEEVLTLYEMNGFSLPTDVEDADGNAVYYTAAGYNVQMTDYENRATSYLLPAATMQLAVDSEEIENFTFQLIDNKHEITKPLLFNQFTYKDGVVDHFYNYSLNSTSIEYQTGKKMVSNPRNIEEALYGVKTYDVDKEGTVWWITSTIQIFPIGICSPITGINYLSSTVDMTDDYTVRLYRTNNVTFPAYNPNTEVYKGSTIFTIYGYNYSFDGQSIYYLGSGDDTTQVSFACYALGMKFLANSGTEAYFYSPFEKCIYLFTGSVTLQKADSLSREGEIIDSLYSSLEQILYLMTDEGNIIAKSQDDMCLIENVDPTAYHFEATDTGMILAGDWLYKKYRLWKTDETEWLPIEYETEWLGKNDSLFKVSSIDITFFMGDKSSVKGQIYYGCLNDKNPKDEIQDFKITAADWDNSPAFKVRFVPKDNVVKAFRFGIKSDDYIHIANVCINTNEISENTNAPAKNGHR